MLCTVLSGYFLVCCVFATSINKDSEKSGVLKWFDLHNRAGTVACRKQRDHNIFFLSNKHQTTWLKENSQKDTSTKDAFT